MQNDFVTAVKFHCLIAVMVSLPSSSFFKKRFWLHFFQVYVCLSYIYWCGSM